MQKQFTIELGGKVRLLKYDMNALACLEEKLGGASLIEAVAKPSIRVQLALVWAGLIWETWDNEKDCPTLKMKEVSDLLTPLLKDEKQHRAVVLECGTAFFAAFPDPDKEETPATEPKNAPSAVGA
jgi:hypothetical protein